jgi:SAM-dependent methyltransferase
MPGDTKYNKPVDKLDFWKQRIDTAAKRYFSVYATSESDWAHINEEHERIIKETIADTAKVLDAGCAYGRLAPLFDYYTGIDFSPDFIEQARAIHPDKEFQVADLRKLPWSQQEFDWAIVVSIKRMIIDNLGEDAWGVMLHQLKGVAKNILVLEYEDPENYEIIG